MPTVQDLLDDLDRLEHKDRRIIIELEDGTTYEPGAILDSDGEYVLNGLEPDE